LAFYGVTAYIDSCRHALPRPSSLRPLLLAPLRPGRRALTRQHFLGPGPHRLLHRVQLLGEEVIGAGDDHALRVAHFLDQLLQLAHVAVLVSGAVQKEHRLLAVTKVAEVVLVDRRADQEEGVDEGQLARHTAGDPGAERKAADEELASWMVLHTPVDGGD